MQRIIQGGMVMDENNTSESLVDQYIKEEKTSEAAELLFDLIVLYAEKKDFAKAEALYEKLYDVDPMALTEIVKAGEAIETAKTQSLDTKHRDVWAELYNKLSANESNALYYETEKKVFKAGEAIIEQGQIGNQMFFINKGKVKAVFSRENKEVLLTILGAGDFFGNDQFFSATVSTVSIIAQENVNVSCLKNTIISKWKTDAPALESKLADYCQKREKIKKAVEDKGMDRREHIRIPLSVNLAFRFIDATGTKNNKAYKGEISDISNGGLSFFIKTSKPDAIRMMLGRRLAVSIPVKQKSGQDIVIEKAGQVSAVQSQVFDDFSIHVKFDVDIEDPLFNSISPSQ